MKISEITKKNIFLLICLSLLITSFFILYEVIYPFVLAFILAYLLSPLTEKLNFYLPRSLAAFISIILFILIVFCVLSLIIPIIIVQFEKIVILAPQYISKLSEYIYSNFSFIIKEKSLNSDNFLNFFKLFLIKIGKTGYDFFQGSIIFLNGIFDVFFTLILSFYMLLELKNVKNFTLNLTNLTSFSFFFKYLRGYKLDLIKLFMVTRVNLSNFINFLFSIIISNWFRFWNNIRNFCWNYILHSVYWSYNRCFHCSCFRWNSIWFKS